MIIPNQLFYKDPPMDRTVLSRSRSKLVYALLASIILMLPFQVNAASMNCRSDPIVFLSDGTRLQFNSTIETNLEGVVGIHYEVHGPVGTQIDRIVFTPRWARDLETIEYIPDQPAGNYHIVTLVQTETSNVSVEVKAMKVSQNNGGQGSTRITASGVSGQPIIITFG